MIRGIVLFVEARCFIVRLTLRRLFRLSGFRGGDIASDEMLGQFPELLDVDEQSPAGTRVFSTELITGELEKSWKAVKMTLSSSGPMMTKSLSSKSMAQGICSRVPVQANGESNKVSDCLAYASRHWHILHLIFVED